MYLQRCHLHNKQHIVAAAAGGAAILLFILIVVVVIIVQGHVVLKGIDTAT